MNSNWQINKIGMVDFWYYDEEEFKFEEGRMLLRGSNGSGKSVTMQSFIPLLLDGNIRPERLDPFGSKARRMENYLLEENDGREERTGYLYMEFKREEAQTYLTIGMGMRARRGKPLDTWYFFLQDGRRIRKDFFLYRQEKNKVPLSKLELRNRIGEGGKVLESQKEYMALVNKLIFGFETVDAYKELIDLLIQLRTPKLSKDFKPTIINEILSSSLMPLSEDDLRPMSEAIENMDGLKTGLDGLKESHGAAKKIERVFGRYNRFMLYEKAAAYKKANGGERSEEKQVSALEKQMTQAELQYQQEQERKEALVREEAIRKQEKEDLAANDAAKLKEQETQLQREIADTNEKHFAKQRNLEAKQERRIELAGKLKEKQNAAEMLQDQIRTGLNEMEEVLEQTTYDEFHFMKKDLEERLEEAYSFSAHRELLERLRKNVEEGIGVFQDEKVLRREYDGILKRVEEYQRSRDVKEREVFQCEEQLRGVKNELLEAVNLWAEGADEFTMPPQDMQQIAVQIEQFQSGDDYQQVREPVRTVWEAASHHLELKRAGLSHNLQTWQQQIQDKEEEIREWEQMEDPAPELPVETIKSRRLLNELGIPYIEFYKAVDFAQGLTGEQINRLEEALLRMGILEALIVDKEDRERILALDPGLCDKYIFSDLTHTGDNLARLLEISNEENDILFYQRISNVLSSIGVEEGGAHTSISKDGHYRLGVLTGTVSGAYQARFIGVNAREQFRREMLLKLGEELKDLHAKAKQVQESIVVLELRKQKLLKQWQQFPGGEDLKVAIQSLDEAVIGLDRVVDELKQEQDKLRHKQSELSEFQLRIQAVCGKVYLAPNLEIFLLVKSELEEYQHLLIDLQMNHRAYLDVLALISDIQEQIEEIDADLDILRYDMHQLNLALKKQEETLASVRQQLGLTNYDEIKEKLDLCIQRLNDIPAERDECAGNIAKLENTIESTKTAREKAVVQLLELRKRTGILREAFMREAALGYYGADLPVDTEDALRLSELILRSEESVFMQVKREDITGDLQAAYHQNRGYLVEYQPIMESIFGEYESEDYPELHLKRLDIMTKYRGISMNFQEFLNRIRQDIEEKESLLSEKERELFEDILVNIISRKIRARIYSSEEWVDKMNELMGNMRTSSGLILSLKWKSKRAEHEGQLDTRRLVELLKKDPHWMSEEEFGKLSAHFRSKIQEARNLLEQKDGIKSFHALIREILDYRQWFEFQLEFQKSGEKKKELTDRMFFTFSGGEKAMSMYVPLFSAVVAKYGAARSDAPRLISLDEAFAGVDEMNITDMFRLMVDFRFAFIINSQILWGDYETVPKLAIYQLLREDNAKFVTVIPYVWTGKEKVIRA